MNSPTTFRDIKTDILRRIASGEWAPGTRLPNELDLAREFGTARATVNRAMRELVDDGIVQRKRKAGTHVRSVPLRQIRLHIPVVRSEIEEQGAGYRYALLHSTIGRPPDWLRARLSLAPTNEVRHLTCIHFADGNPYQMEDRWINLSATPAARLADFSQSGPSEWLIRQVPFSDVEVSFSATAADAGQAENLGCAKGDPLFRIERQTFWQSQPITFVRLIYQRGYRLASRY